MHRRQVGFTLMEMLVTLVLFALVSGLLWQSMATVARVEGGLNTWTRDNRDAALREEWLREMLRGMATGARADPQVFQGAADFLRCHTHVPPWPDLAGPLVVEARLEREADVTTLRIRAPASGRELELFRWKAPVRFEYLDESGEWRAAWAERTADQIPLPLAVRLVGVPGGDLLTAVQSMFNPMLRRVEIEQP